MSSSLPVPIENLIESLRILPGVGQKTAARLAFFLLRNPEATRQKLGNSILDVSHNLRKCAKCGHFADETICGICQDTRRDQSIICVVEDALDLLAVEKSSAFKGLYHVLGGALAPLDGIGPEDLEIDSLVARLQAGEVSEIIVATNPTLEGEATAALLQRRLINFPMLKITRLARGIPVGGDVEYADEITLARSLENRVML